MTENIQDYKNLKDRMLAFEVPMSDRNIFVVWTISEILKKHGEFENYAEEISVLFNVVERYKNIEDREFKKLQKRIKQIKTNWREQQRIDRL